jgi:nitrate/nitrite transport system substrate-binding protein
MVSQLKAGHIDGFCVGEPWNQVAVAEGLGRVLITSYEIWNNGPEKVLGVNQDWAERHPNTHRALLMALLEAARWLDAHENRREVVDILSGPAYVNAPKEQLKMSMTGTFCYGPGEDPVVMPDFNCFFRFAATFPWRSHAEWFMTQMLRWGQVEGPLSITATAARVYRPDLYREAASALGLAVPDTDHKTEGTHGRGWILQEASQPLAMGPDRFFDGMTFKPADLLGYVAGFPVSRASQSADNALVR